MGEDWEIVVEPLSDYRLPGKFGIRVGMRGEFVEGFTAPNLASVKDLLRRLKPDGAMVLERSRDLDDAKRIFRRPVGGISDELVRWTLLKLEHGASEVALELKDREEEPIRRVVFAWAGRRKARAKQ
jgi:hypothetical protein